MGSWPQCLEWPQWHQAQPQEIKDASPLQTSSGSSLHLLTAEDTQSIVK